MFEGSGLGHTLRLARWTARTAVEEAAPDASMMARHAILNWVAVTIASSGEEAVRILDALLQEAGSGDATLVG